MIKSSSAPPLRPLITYHRSFRIADKIKNTAKDKGWTCSKTDAAIQHVWTWSKQPESGYECHPPVLGGVWAWQKCAALRHMNGNVEYQKTAMFMILSWSAILLPLLSANFFKSSSQSSMLIFVSTKTPIITPIARPPRCAKMRHVVVQKSNQTTAR